MTFPFFSVFLLIMCLILFMFCCFCFCFFSFFSFFSSFFFLTFVLFLFSSSSSRLRLLIFFLLCSLPHPSSSLSRLSSFFLLPLSIYPPPHPPRILVLHPFTSFSTSPSPDRGSGAHVSRKLLKSRGRRLMASSSGHFPFYISAPAIIFRCVR